MRLSSLPSPLSLGAAVVRRALGSTSKPVARVAQAPAVVAGSGAARAASMLSKLEALLGSKAIEELRQAARSSSAPLVLIKGDMLTGKSTQAKGLAKALGREDAVGSVGSQVMRPMAAARNLTIEQLGERLKDEPGLEAEVDYQALLLAARGSVAVLESRLAGDYGALLERLGRKNVVTVELLCGPRERALRLVERLAGPQARQRIEPKLAERPRSDLAQYLEAIALLGDPDPKLATLAEHGAELAGRDLVDAERLRALYGFDYREDGHRSAIVIDTSRLGATAVEAELKRRVTSKLESAPETDLRAVFGTSRRSVPELVSDWQAATLEAAVLETARRSYQEALTQAVLDAEAALGRDLTPRERRTVLTAVDAANFPAAEPRARAAVMGTKSRQQETIRQAQLDYARGRGARQRDPFAPLVQGAPASRAEERVLFESPTTLVVVDRFAQAPKALVIPKRFMTFPTEATGEELRELARVSGAVSRAFSRLSGAEAEVWINPPQHLTVKRLHVHVAPPRADLLETEALWAELSSELHLGLSAAIPQDRSPFDARILGGNS